VIAYGDAFIPGTEVPGFYQRRVAPRWFSDFTLVQGGERGQSIREKLSDD